VGDRRTAVTAVAVGTAIVVLALCLRSGVSSLGVVLHRVQADLHLSATTTGALTTLPALCFAVVGLGAGRAILRYGAHRVTVVLLLTVAAGLVCRSVTGSGTVFLLGTAVAMAGAALGNVVLPPLAKLHFPDRIALVSAIYGAALMGGATLAATTTVPLADALGGWRWGLGFWAIPPVVGAVLWLPTVLRERTGEPRERRSHAVSLGQLARTRTGQAMLLCFAAQSAQAYVQFGWWGEILTSAGADDAHAGALLGVLAGIGIPVTLSLPALMRVTHGSIVLPVAFAAVTVVGWTGVATAPLALGGWLWAVLLGMGGGAFTWVLAMIPARSRTPDGTSQLSALTQGFGYLGASVATFGTGLLHEATGSWTPAIVIMAVLAVAIAVTGAVVVKSPPVEEQLR
jgi:CP family cyanate transporter-like MFS transporter